MIKFITILAIFLALTSYSQIHFQAAYSTGNDMFSSIQQTTDQSYVMAGWELGFGNNPSVLVKIDTTGVVQWQKRYSNSDGFLVNMYMINKMISTSDGGFVFTGNVAAVPFLGSSYSDLFITKTDASGNITWSNRYGTDSTEAGNFIIETTDGGFLAVGYTDGFGAKDSTNIYIVKTNSAGSLTWDKAVQISNDDDDQGLSVKETTDGYIFAGYTSQVQDPDTTTDIAYFKTDFNGNIQWLHTQGDISDDDQAGAIDVLTNGDIVLGGYTGNTSGLNSSDLFLWKINNSNGNVSSTYKYDLNTVDVISKISATTDGGLVLTGYNGLLGFKPFLIKCDATLTPENAHEYDSGSLSIYNDVDATADGGYVIGTMGGDSDLGYVLRITKADQDGFSGCFQDSLSVPRLEFPVSIETPSYSVFSGGNRSGYTPDIETDWTVEDTIYCSYIPCDTPDVVISPVNPTICSGDNQVLTASGCDAGSYTWSTNETADAITVTPTSQTTYTVTGYVGVCPSREASVTVNVNPVPTALINSVDNGNETICENTSTTLTASGGGTYLWDNGLGTNSNQTVSPTTTTTYNVTVTSGGCTDVTSYTVNVNTAPTATVSGGSTICDDGSTSNITIDFTGSANWSFEWALNGNNQGTISNISSSPYIIPVDTAGTYTLISVSDNSGCNGTVSGSATVIVNSLPTVSISGNTSICDGETTILTATGGGDYLWSTGSTNDTTIVSPTGNTNYTVTVTNTTTGCSNTEIASVTVNSLPIISITGNTTICKGDTTTLYASGGTSYIWSTNDTNDSIVVTPSISTTYYVTASNANCSDTASQQIIVNSLPAVTITGNTSICNGDTTILVATGGDSYEWSTNSTIDSIIVSPSTTTNYTVTVTSSSTTCSNTETQEVVVTQLPVITFSGDSIICFGDNASLTANGADTYLWNTAETTSNINVSPTNDSIYYVIGTSSGCNSDTSYINVMVNSLPTAYAGEDTTICTGYSITLHGTGGDSYEWLPSSSLNDANIQNPIATPTSTTSYILTVTDANMCSNSDTITVNLLPAPNYTISTNDLLCNGDNNASAWISYINGQGPFSYNWDNNSTDSIITNLSGGTYYLTITDGIGCNYFDHAFVYEPSQLTDTLETSNVLCYGENTGNIIVNANGGTTPYIYQWNTGATDSILNNIEAGTYSVSIIDANNCNIEENNIVITQPNSTLSSSLSTQNNISCYGLADGSLSVETSGGTPSYTYLWSNSETTNSLNNISAGYYYLTVTDANNCTEIDTFIVTQPDTLIVETSLIMDGYKGNASAITTGGTPEYSYIWSNGENTQNITNLVAGNYVVTVTDQNGCTANSLLTVDVELLIPTVITPNNDTKNDYFNIIGIQAFSNVEIHVFNRWGDEVYYFDGSGIEYSDSSVQWDGTTKSGKILPLGSYVYIVYLNNKEQEYNGTVTIVR